MLQLNYLRESPEEVIRRLATKNFQADELVAEILQLDDGKRSLQKQFDETQAISNKLSSEIGQLYKSGRQAEAEALKEQTAALKTKSKELSEALVKTQQALEEKLIQLPNLPHPNVKPGINAEDNEIVSQEGSIDAGENFLPHWELAAKYGIIDFEVGTKIAGAGFPLYVGKGAKLQRALINFFLDKATENGYKEVQTPLFANPSSAFGTGQLPDKDGQMYHIGQENFYLIPTAEVPITNIYRDLIIAAEDLPVKNVGYSSCFRREAGSYGKDVRGLNRLHQFDKVEIVQIQKPEASYDSLEEMKDYVCYLLKLLELPFRVLKLCGGDTSFTAALTYDMEVFSLGQKKWLEVSSVSNFETFQSNRMKLRYRDAQKKTQLLHTLNGSALALPRIVAALLENYQTPDGILVPKCLIPYTQFEIIN